MAPKRPSPISGEIDVQVSFNPAKSRLVRLGDFAVWDRYSVRINDQQFPFVVELDVVLEDGKPSCQAVHLERRPGEVPIKGGALRLPIAGFLRHTTPQVAMRAVKGQKGAWAPIREEDVDAFYAAYRKTERKSRRDRITDERLAEVANIYRAAVNTGAAPVEQVRKTLDISRSHAGRLVMRARRAGYLGATRPGKAGEEGGKK